MPCPGGCFYDCVLVLGLQRGEVGYVATVANFLDDNKPISDLKVYLHYFKLHRSYSISFKLENVDEIFFGTVSIVV